jgi:hypothetical protein
MVKSADGYFKRLERDPGYRREMSERQRALGMIWPRSILHRHVATARTSDRYVGINSRKVPENVTAKPGDGLAPR